MNIVDWEYYNSLHSAVKQEDFNRLELLAEKHIRAIIGTPRWNSIDPNAFYYDQLRDCVCAIVNKLALDEKSGAGSGVSVVSNDGYSEHYAVQTHQQLVGELRSCVIQWLSGTGLVGAYRC